MEIENTKKTIGREKSEKEQKRYRRGKREKSKK